MAWPYTIDWTATAAWVQAVGSIAAILVAVWLQDRQRQSVRRDRAKDTLEVLADTAHQAYKFISLADHAVKGGSWTKVDAIFFGDRMRGLVELHKTLPVLHLRTTTTRTEYAAMLMDLLDAATLAAELLNQPPTKEAFESFLDCFEGSRAVFLTALEKAD